MQTRTEATVGGAWRTTAVVVSLSVIAVLICACSSGPGAASGGAQAATAVNCGSIDLTDAATGQLAVPVGTPMQATASLGGLRATLYGTATMATAPVRQPALATATIVISLRGKQILSTDVTSPHAPGDIPLIPANVGRIGVPIWSNPTAGTAAAGGGLQPLCLARFGGATPTTAVLVGTYTGGMHCCTWVAAYPVVSNRVRSTPVEYSVGNPGAGTVNRGGHAVIVTADNSFDYQFASFGGSGTPIVTLELRNGKFVNTTKGHPGWVATDAAYWWGLYQSSQPGLGLGVLAAWTADECLLGKGPRAFSTLRQLATEGRLSAHGQLAAVLSGWPSGSAYVSQVQRFLSAHGYCG